MWGNIYSLYSSTDGSPSKTKFQSIREVNFTVWFCDFSIYESWWWAFGAPFLHTVICFRWSPLVYFSKTLHHDDLEVWPTSLLWLQLWFFRVICFHKTADLVWCSSYQEVFYCPPWGQRFGFLVAAETDYDVPQLICGHWWPSQADMYSLLQPFAPGRQNIYFLRSCKDS